MKLLRMRSSKLFIPMDKVLVGCTFQAQKFRSDGTITHQGPEFHNTVLDVGLDKLAVHRVGLVGGTGSWNNNASTINVGTGSSVPAQGQSGLDSYLASTSSIYGSSTSGYDIADPIHRWSKSTYEFAIGSCTGNLTEVGLSKEDNTDYFNRQLFRDELGDPVTITVASDEGLRVTCTLYLYGDMQPGDIVSGSFLLNNSDTINYDRELTSDTGWLTTTNTSSLGFLGIDPDDGRMFGIAASTTTFDASGEANADSHTTLAYSAGSFYRDYECVWNPGTFIGDINSILFEAMFPPPYGGVGTRSEHFSAFRLSPAVSVTDVDEVTITFRRAWGRVEESS